MERPLVAPLLMCAQHGRWLEGERPLWRLIAPTISGRQGRCREAGSGGSRKQNCGLRNTKHVRGYPSRASWQQAAKPNAIKDLGSKRDKRAEKVNVLTWGDLLSGFQSNPDCEVRLRQQGSAEVIVPIFFSGRTEHQEDE